MDAHKARQEFGGEQCGQGLFEQRDIPRCDHPRRGTRIDALNGRGWSGTHLHQHHQCVNHQTRDHRSWTRTSHFVCKLLVPTTLSCSFFCTCVVGLVVQLFAKRLDKILGLLEIQFERCVCAPKGVETADFYMPTKAGESSLAR